MEVTHFVERAKLRCLQAGIRVSTTQTDLLHPSVLSVIMYIPYHFVKVSVIFVLFEVLYDHVRLMLQVVVVGVQAQTPATTAAATTRAEELIPQADSMLLRGYVVASPSASSREATVTLVPFGPYFVLLHLLRVAYDMIQDLLRQCREWSASESMSETQSRYLRNEVGVCLETSSQLDDVDRCSPGQARQRSRLRMLRLIPVVRSPVDVAHAGVLARAVVTESKVEGVGAWRNEVRERGISSEGKSVAPIPR
jgi:hypothetical protein